MILLVQISRSGGELSQSSPAPRRRWSASVGGQNELAAGPACAHRAALPAPPPAVLSCCAVFGRALRSLPGPTAPATLPVLNPPQSPLPRSSSQPKVSSQCYGHASIFISGCRAALAAWRLDDTKRIMELKTFHSGQYDRLDRAGCRYINSTAWNTKPLKQENHGLERARRLQVYQQSCLSMCVDNPPFFVSLKTRIDVSFACSECSPTTRQPIT